MKEWSLFDRFRLFLGGELSHLVSWILPKTEFDDRGCDSPPEWIIYDNEPYKFTYSCTLHLSGMVSIDTEAISPYEAVDIHKKQKTCCYLYSISDEEAKLINQVD